MLEDLKLRVAMTRQNTVNLPQYDQAGNQIETVPTYSVKDYLAFLGLLVFAGRVV